ncbi:hypothetical protein [Nocardioides sp. CFH 31398]|uniref:hypothetical protein n=1 Tax=Nocardioides sp. CFH 31398 TaxID=2919579 RepID=UPI001F070E92|nr:hypothetical protein [Nocardioides sp. CFH 31398]MCH1865739.1 hypothetical protein [Nocardioides sp. CFH 31398]
MDEVSPGAVMAFAIEYGYSALPLADFAGGPDQLGYFMAALGAADDPEAFAAYWEGQAGSDS